MNKKELLNLNKEEIIDTGNTVIVKIFSSKEMIENVDRKRQKLIFS
jgi:hypothetical protein